MFFECIFHSGHYRYIAFEQGAAAASAKPWFSEKLLALANIQRPFFFFYIRLGYKNIHLFLNPP